MLCSRAGDLGELVWSALDLDVVDDGLEEAADEVGERVEVVHLWMALLVDCSRHLVKYDLSSTYPVAPEGLDLRIRHHDAAEIDQESSNDDGVRECREVGVRAVSGDCLSDRRIEELVEDHLQVHLPRRTRLDWESG